VPRGRCPAAFKLLLAPLPLVGLFTV